MKRITIHLPEKALKQVNQWADGSNTPRDKFYMDALMLGSRVMAISVPPDFLADLSKEELENVSEMANRGVTPKNVLQIITGAKSRTLLNGSEEPIVEIIVTLPDDLFSQFSEQTDRMGMQPEKIFALAFAMGARAISINNQLKR